MIEHDTVMSVADAARILKAGRSTVYELIRQGKIPAKRLGRAGYPLLFTLIWWGLPAPASA